MVGIGADLRALTVHEEGYSLSPWRQDHLLASIVNKNSEVNVGFGYSGECATVLSGYVASAYTCMEYLP